SSTMGNSTDTAPDSSTSPTENAGLLTLLIPREGYFATPILLYINLAVFILMAISGVSIFEPSNESLIQWGANFKPATLAGEWWRIVTSCFVHIGIIHLLMNMYALTYIGLLLEPYLGRVQFFLAYILTGVAASTTSLWWNDFVISAGASGAIFGLYGIFLAMLISKLIPGAERRALLTSIGVFVAFNLINGIRGGIDNAAHIGGVVSGFIAGFLLIPALKRGQHSKPHPALVLAITAVTISGSFAVYKTLPNDIVIYEEKFAEFAALESEALEVYSISTDTPKDSILHELETKGINNWKESINLIKDLNHLKLPPALYKRNKLLLEYCKLRLESCELVYKTIKEDTEEFTEKLEDTYHKIDGVLKALSNSNVE
ncbi:MAG TPA: rhomboid family intramembrane serine protease, partial [Parasegetibacter sp.]